MTVAARNEKMSVSKATSTLIGLILQMSPQDIMETLTFVEGKGAGRKAAGIEPLTEVMFVVNDRLFKGMARMVSAEDMIIRTGETFHTGDRITLSFEHPLEGRQIKTTGTIDRPTPEGIRVHVRHESLAAPDKHS
ncbi:hypothetical protein JCM14469_13710 [Desulfatiferula olefinivorans]